MVRRLLRRDGDELLDEELLLCSESLTIPIVGGEKSVVITDDMFVDSFVIIVVAMGMLLWLLLFWTEISEFMNSENFRCN